MYKYYGAPAVALRAGGLAGHDYGADETSKNVICEVCRIQCSSLDNLRIHEIGKKHKMNLEMLQGKNGRTSNLVKKIPEVVQPATCDAVGASTIPAADGVMPSVQPKKNKSTAATPEDLEEKKRRVLEAGAAEGELEIRTMSNAVKKIPKVVQRVTCEVCKMRFNSLKNFRDHETRNRHKKNYKKNLKKLQDSITPEPVKPPNDAVGASTEPAAAAVADGVVPTARPKKKRRSARTPKKDLEVKRRRVFEQGTPEDEVKNSTMSDVIPKVVQPVTCEVNSLNSLKGHEAGKKNLKKFLKKNLKKLQDSITPEPAKSPKDAVGASTEPAAAAVADGVVPTAQPKKKRRSARTPKKDLEVKRRRVFEQGTPEDEVKNSTMSDVIPKVVQPVTCEVNSLNSLKGHEAGKKNLKKFLKKNLKKLQDSITPEPAKSPNDAVGASTEPAAAAVADGVVPAVPPKKNKRSAGTPEDLEVKRRRVLEHGTPEGEVKICTACNVIVQSSKDYESHIAGHKHNTKLQKQQQVQASSPSSLR